MYAVCGHTCHGKHAKVQEQLLRVGSHLPICVSQDKTQLSVLAASTGTCWAISLITNIHFVLVILSPHKNNSKSQGYGVERFFFKYFLSPSNVLPPMYAVLHHTLLESHRASLQVSHCMVALWCLPLLWEFSNGQVAHICRSDMKNVMNKC